MNRVAILEINPYKQPYAKLIPWLVDRISKDTQAMGDIDDAIVKNFFGRLFYGDVTVLLLAAVDPTGNIKGYAAAAFAEGVAHIIQPRLDEPTENDAVAEMMDRIEAWAKSKGSVGLTLMARRVDKKWLEKYGFTVKRYYLEKDITEQN